MAPPRVPVATYRLQFSPRFGFSDAASIVPYLDALGISDLYASPVLAAMPGSAHGYDVIDPLRLNPELGGDSGFREMTSALRECGMGLLLDIVPNHMAAEPHNPWWRDVLEDGPASPFASYFDIDWAREQRVVLPLLAAPLEELIAGGDLELELREDGLVLRYHETALPLRPESYAGALAGAPAEVRTVASRMARLPPGGDERSRAKTDVRPALWRICQNRPALSRSVKDVLRSLAEDREAMQRLLAEQHFRLAYWRPGIEEMNYRRFFDISGLVCLRAEDPPVSEATHRLVFDLVERGDVTGLRVDHIDGLRDPAAYLRRLQERLAPESVGRGDRPGFCVLAEKILTGHELLPDDWLASGTTGYDWLNSASALLVDPDGLKRLQRVYARFVGDEPSPVEVRYRAKKEAAEQLFPAEMRELADLLSALAAGDGAARALPREDLARAVIEVTACLPVYRTYIRSLEVTDRDRVFIERAVEDARRRGSPDGALDFLRRVLLLEGPPERREDELGFVMRWQQYSGPVMAKGVEDTALYRYSALVSLNEVGSDAVPPTDPVAAFHRRNPHIQERWPLTLNATSTHDTKRSGDVRARIDVLSELADDWEECLRRWSRWNAAHGSAVDGRPAPDPAEEAILYQTLVGVWPLDSEDLPALPERVKAYMVKAAREAKANTSWLDPNPAHEEALRRFVDACLDPSRSQRFLDDLTQLVDRVAYYGALNSLSQTLLKIASPGVPDFYQGTELWSFSLVDPDSRRPVDFERRAALLSDLDVSTAGRLDLARDLLASWRDGRVKLYVTRAALASRRNHPEMFAFGEYLPLAADGGNAGNVVSFARRRGDAWALAVVPRLMARLAGADGAPLGSDAWGATRLRLPSGAPEAWRHAFTGRTLEAGGSSLPLADVLSDFPVALLTGGPGAGA